MRDINQTIGNLIDNQSTAYVASVDPNGYPCVKAMFAPRKRIGIHTFYFTTNTSSLRVRQFTANPKACVYFSDKRFFRGVMLQGRMEILQDPESKTMIWKEGDTLYYKGGVTDPDYCVLKFTAVCGRYYSNFNSEDFTVSNEE